MDSVMTDSQVASFISNQETLGMLQAYPSVSALFNESAAVVFYVLKKMEGLTMQFGTFHISWDKVGEWTQEGTWKLFKDGLDKHIEELFHTKYRVPYKSELSNARRDICKLICSEFKRVLPYWPKTVLEGKVTKSFELKTGGCYEFNKQWITWQAVGWMEVCVDPCMLSYNIGFSGDPEIKLAIVDMVKVHELEEKCKREGLEETRQVIMTKAVKAKVIKSVDTWGFLD